MTPDSFLKSIVDPTLKMLADWPGIHIPLTDSGRVLTMTIAGQETGWCERRQVPVAYARSYWQFEEAGGVAGLFATMPKQLRAVCESLDIPFDQATVFEAMAWNDVLACSMARFLLWVDPAPLPAVGDKDAGWQYYIRGWRPGAPRPDAWGGFYDHSLAAMRGTA